MIRNLSLTVLLLMFFSFFHSSCEKKNDESNHYTERKLSFFGLRHGELLSNTWIREPQNLWMIHETLKSFGYNRLYAEEIISTYDIIFNDIYIDKPILDLLDSLEITYEHPETRTEYYEKFWKRRETEKNDSVVYKIVRDVNEILSYKSDASVLVPKANPMLVNDTLLNLLELEFRSIPMTEKQGLEDFNILKNYGLHQSAYDLVYDQYIYSDLEWNRDSLKQTLTVSNEWQGSWFGVDTKVVSFLD